MLVADSVASLGLKYAVVTSVTRDDLPDGGASVFAATIRAIRRESPGTRLEVLVPDFQGSEEALEEVVNAAPDVLGHNLETVPRLYPVLRRGASYERSLELLRRVREYAPDIVTKSGIMVGVGEAREEIIQVAADLVKAGSLILTIGQYLRPTRSHYPVHRFLPPQEFQRLRDEALAAGMAKVFSGPLVRSSYLADEVFQELGGRSRPSPPAGRTLDGDLGRSINGTCKAPTPRPTAQRVDGLFSRFSG